MINIAVSGAAGMISNHLLFKVRILVPQTLPLESTDPCAKKAEKHALIL